MMNPLFVSIDSSGDLKIGTRKCRLHKKSDIVKTAKMYNISTDKKTVPELCSAIKSAAKSTVKSPNNNNNVPLLTN